MIIHTFRKCSDGFEETNSCSGLKDRIVPCRKTRCPAEWSQWSEFSNCSESCGQNGIKIRNRNCINNNRNVSQKRIKLKRKE